ncbi:ribosomal subunit interface protein [Paenibacillus sp. MY03]|jgi:putative sigma-54 modulation protein|uniref:ribosome hibernation-promoting factor, HPF/YfiA family n=1 Tax=Paenibacillus TaxID=44249 RepID=UPI000B3C7991|nr:MULTISPECIES: ribosome-associated translation inhibitor RaiA [Paenibacillus]OUS75123.1 ribosomal subunit interface protein [Paenibacillus sp. MY03]QNK58384.1 ribosome-associated translation inhibitor RaiA [Paenibacillus sp. PAMC21692]
MNYNIRGQRFQVTDALRDYVEKKLSRLERYFESPITSEINVTLSVTKAQHTVEVMIPLVGVMLRAEDKSEDMYASIDMVVDKLERQIRKYKTKVNRKFRQGSGVRALFREEGSAVSVLEEEEDLELVRTKRHILKPMDVEEAILQMNMVGHNFFVFANAESKEVNVVYRRSDGKYGLIEQG